MKTSYKSLILFLALSLASLVSGVELAQFQNRCYQCLMLNTTRAFYCGGLNRCYNVSTDLTRNCTMNATDFMKCPTQARCLVESFLPKENVTNLATNALTDHIVIKEHHDGWANFTYEVRPNSRCQLMIFNGLVVDFEV